MNKAGRYHTWMLYCIIVCCPLAVIGQQYRHWPYTIVIGSIGHCNWIDELVINTIEFYKH